MRPAHAHACMHTHFQAPTSGLLLTLCPLVFACVPAVEEEAYEALEAQEKKDEAEVQVNTGLALE